MPKRSEEYWQKRFEEILVSNEKIGLNYEKEMAGIYEQTKQNLQKELESFYQRYANQTGLDLAEVKKQLNPAQLKRFRVQQQVYLDKVKKLIEQGADLSKYEETLKKLSARAYVTKLQELQNNLNSEITLLTGEQQVKLTKTLGDSYLQGYFKSVYALQKGIGFGYSFTVPNNQDVKKVLQTPWNGNNYSKSIWNNKAKLTNWLNTDLPRHFAAGNSVQQMSNDLVNKVETNYKNAVRLVRTEVNYITNQSTMDAYEEQNVDRYQILATLDSRTSDICRDLDGKVVDVKDRQVAVNMPPFHVNCRTTTIPYFEDEEWEDLERVARDDKGNNYTVPANMTYNEWNEKYGQGAKVKQGKTVVPQVTSVAFEDLDDEQVKRILTDVDNKDLASKIEKEYEQEEFEYNNLKTQLNEMNKELNGELQVPEGVDKWDYIKEFTDKYNTLANKMNNIDENKKNRVLSLLRQGNNTFELGNVSENFEGMAIALQQDMKGVVDDSLLPQHRINVGKAWSGRAYYSNKEKTLYLSKLTKKHTTPHHEFMHALEDANPSLMNKSIRFLQYRTKGEDAKLLSELTGKDTYRQDEFAKADKFFNAYCGKQYKVGNEYRATEILSMGFEKLLTDGAQFYKTDPEYFNFVVNAIKGKI